MANVSLASVIIPQRFLEYQEVPSLERIAFFQSGVVFNDDTLNAVANTGGQITTMPFWNDLDATVEPNISTANSADVATPQGMNSGEMIVRINDYNQSWGAADLAGALAGSDPMASIRRKTDMYWMRQWQHKLVSTCLGVMQSNIANNAGDMVHDISLQTTVGVSAANQFSETAFAQTAFTFGDRYDDVSAIAVHSHTYAQMQAQQVITFVQPAGVPLSVPMYANKYVIVDDGMPVVAGTTSGFRYVSVLFGPGAFAYGKGDPKVPVEAFRYPYQGNGGGVETLHIRKRWLIQPAGHSFTSASITTQSEGIALGLINADLANPANWSRKVPRKNVKLAFLITN